MKKLILFVILLISSQVFSQKTLDGFSYQAVVRSVDGLPLSEKEVNVYIDLFSKDQGSPLYSEEHLTVTDKFGQFSLIIGQGELISGNLQSVPWESGSIFYRVEISNIEEKLEIISEAELLAVPYAFYAVKAGKIVMEDQPEGAGGSGPSKGSVWSTKGNEDADKHSDPPLLGTSDLNPIVFITNDIERMRITETGDIQIVGSNTIDDDLVVKGNAILNSEYGTTEIRGAATIGGNLMNPTNMTGDVTIDKALYVEGAAEFNDEVEVNGTTQLNSNLNVNNGSATHLTGTLDIDGKTELNNALVVDGSTNLNNALFVNNGNPTDLSGSLNVDGNTDLNGNVDINGTTQLNQTLDVVGNTSLDSDLNVAGNTTLNGTLALNDDLTVIGKTQLDSSLTVVDETVLQSSLSVDGATSLNSDLDVSGNTDLGGNMNVDGTAQLNQTLDVVGNASLNSDLDVAGNTKVIGNIEIDGGTDLNSSLNVNNGSPTGLSGSLKVAGNTDIDGNANVDGTTQLNQTLDVVGNTSLDSDLNVAGNTTLDGATTLNGTLALNDDLTVIGKTQLDSSLTVVDVTVLQSSLTVDGAAALNSDLDVSGNTDIGGNMNVDGTAQLNQTLDVVGNASLNSDLDVAGNTKVIGNIEIDGGTDLNSSLNVNNGSPTDMSGSLNVDGVTTLNDDLNINGQLSLNGGAVFNENGLNKDFRIESLNDQHMFFVDANGDGGKGRVGIRNSNPLAALDVKGPMWVRGGNVVFNQDAQDYNVRIESMQDEHLFLAKPNGEGRIGIGTSNPQAKLHVRGSFLTRGGDVTINNESENHDVRVKSVNNPNMFFVDGDQNRVGIGTNVPTATLDVRGSAVFNEDGLDKNIRIESQNDENLFFTKASNNRIGIRTNAPSATLDVVGATELNGTTKINGSTTTDDGNVIFNEKGGSYNFRVESQSRTKMLVVDSDLDMVGIGFHGSAKPTATLEVNGTLKTKNGNVTINEPGEAYDFRVESNNENNMLFLSGSQNQIGIRTNAPSATLDVVGTTELNGTTTVNGKSILKGNLIVEKETTLEGIVEVDSTLKLNSNLTTRNGRTVFNETGGDFDLRAESVNAQNMFFIDAGKDRIGIKTGNPKSTLDINGILTVRDSAILEDALYVSGGKKTTLSGNLAVEKGTTLEGNLVVEKGTTLEGELLVKKGTTLEGIVVIDSTLEVRDELTTKSGKVVLNEGGGDFDTRIESDGHQNMLLVDASANRIGVKTSAPESTLDVNGVLTVRSNTQLEDVLYVNNGKKTDLSGKLFVAKETSLNDGLIVNDTTENYVATFTNYHSGSGDGIKIQLGREKTGITGLSRSENISKNKRDSIKFLIDADYTGDKVALLVNIVEEGLDEDIQMIGGLTVNIGNILVDFINDKLGLPIDFPKVELPKIEAPQVKTPDNWCCSLSNIVLLPKTTILSKQNLLDPFEVVPDIPEVTLSKIGIDEIELDDLDFWGVPNIPLVDITTNPIDNNNEFIHFSDVNDAKMGAIRGVSIGDWCENYLNPAFLHKLYKALTSAVDKKHARYHFISEVNEAIDNYNAIGVEYTSGNGDYAEWLQRMDVKESVSKGDIVAVIGGKITKDLSNAEQVMVVSHNPIVLGNIPLEGKSHLGNNVAFMGQVPVKILGPVHTGDYIVAVEETPGYGRAINPKNMSIEDFKLAVGRSWESVPSEGPKMVNTVVGVHNGDYLKILQKMEKKFVETENRFNTLEAQVEQLSSMISPKVVNK